LDFGEELKWEQFSGIGRILWLKTED